MGGEISTDFKSSNRIEISRLVQVLLNFGLIPGVPPLGGRGWVDGGGGGKEVHPTHTHAHMHVHARARTYDIIGNPRDFPKSNGGRHLQGIIMFTMHARACVCVCTPQPPHTPIHPDPPPPEPQGAQNSKIQQVLN